VVESIDELAGDGEQTRPGKEAAPAPEAPAAPPAPASPKAAPAKPAPAAPAPKEPAPDEKSSDGIKVVTDDDLREIFDASQPGIQPGSKAPEPTPEAVIESAPKPAAAPEPSPPAEDSLIASRPGIPAPPPAPDPTSQFIAGAPEPPPKKAQPATEQEEAGDLLREDEASDEMVDQIEDRAEVGEMTFVPTAKKGDALQKTAELMLALDPAGDDFMNTDELKKLFNNVNILIEWARETSERLERLEDKLEELFGAKDKG
jgi:hypothetical protein